MAEIVNIDDLLPVSRSFRLRGQVYTVRQLTVAEWAERTRQEKAEAEARGDRGPDVLEAADKMVADIAALVDGLDEAAIRSLPLEGLNKVWRFVNGDDLREAVAQVEAAKAAAEGR